MRTSLESDGGYLKQKKKEELNYKRDDNLPGQREYSRSRSRSRSNEMRNRVQRRKPPRAAVVAIGRTSEDVSYADILRKARSDIFLSQMGIEKSKVRLAKSGDVLIEIYGEDKKEKTHRLANRLVNLTEGIQVRRLEKHGTLRIYGFDASINEDDIKECLSIAGDCPTTEFRMGTRIKAFNGLYSTTVRCPLETAIAISKLEKVKLGWTSVSVILLKARPQRCFKRLELGHINAVCTSRPRIEPVFVTGIHNAVILHIIAERICFALFVQKKT